MISILNNIKDKSEVQEEYNDPDIESEKSNHEENNEIISVPNAGDMKSETIDRTDFESIIVGYSEKDAVEKFVNNISIYETLER